MVRSVAKRRVSNHTIAGTPSRRSPGKCNGYGADRMKLERDGLVRLDKERRHDGAGDDELAGAQAIAELRRDGGDMTNDVDQVSGIGLEIVRHIERAARTRHAAAQSGKAGTGAR